MPSHGQIPQEEPAWGFWQAPRPPPTYPMSKMAQPRSCSNRSGCLAGYIELLLARPCDYGSFLPRLTPKVNYPGQSGSCPW